MQYNIGKFHYLSNPCKHYQVGTFPQTVTVHLECQVTGLKKNHRDLFVRFIANLGLRIRLTTHSCPQQSPHVVSCLDYFSVDLCCSNPVIICQVPIRLRGRWRRSRLEPGPGWPKSWKPRRRKLRLRQLWWWRRRWWWHQGPASTNPRSHGTVPEKTCRNHQIIERIKAGLFFIPADIASKQLQLLQPVNYIICNG